MSNVTVSTSVYVCKYTKENYNIAKETRTLGFTFKPNKLPSLALIATDHRDKFRALACVIKKPVISRVIFDEVNGSNMGINQYSIEILKEGIIDKYAIGGTKGSRPIDLEKLQECLLSYE